MDKHSNIGLDTHEDSELFLNVLSNIYILQKEIDLLEFTGEFHADDSETCEHLINSLRNILMKKIIIIDHVHDN